MNYMINKIVAIQGNHPSKLTLLQILVFFWLMKSRIKKYKIFYYDPKDLSIIQL